MIEELGIRAAPRDKAAARIPKLHTSVVLIRGVRREGRLKAVLRTSAGCASHPRFKIPRFKIPRFKILDS
jgi:hypothetical protein